MRKLLFCLVSLAVCLFAVSCEREGGNEGAELKANTYSVDGVEGTLKSVAVMMVGENISIVATPDGGVTSAEAILECENYLFASVSPLLVGKEFDIKNEATLFTFINLCASLFGNLSSSYNGIGLSRT